MRTGFNGSRRNYFAMPTYRLNISFSFIGCHSGRRILFILVSQRLTGWYLRTLFCTLFHPFWLICRRTMECMSILCRLACVGGLHYAISTRFVRYCLIEKKVLVAHVVNENRSEQSAENRNLFCLTKYLIYYV